jgi:hypothetical protein
MDTIDNRTLAAAINRGQAIPNQGLLHLARRARADGFTHSDLTSHLAQFLLRSRTQHGTWQAAWNALIAERGGYIELRAFRCLTCNGKRYDMRTAQPCRTCQGTNKGTVVRIWADPAEVPVPDASQDA